MIQLFFRDIFVTSRISRRTWWIAMVFSLLILRLLFSILVWLLIFVFPIKPLTPIPLSINWLFFLPLLFFSFLTIKRFHDRGKGAWFVLLFYPWFIINFSPISNWFYFLFIVFPPLQVLALLSALWVIIECGFLKGTTGPNQYGPDPLAPADVQQPVAVTQTPIGEQQTPPTVPSTSTV